MTLKQSVFEVWLPSPDLGPDTPPDHVVTITSGDQLRGELEAGRLKLPPMAEAPLNATALWLWAAMARLELTQLKAREFLASPPEFQPVKGDDGAPLEVEVGPTTAGPGQSG